MTRGSIDVTAGGLEPDHAAPAPTDPALRAYLAALVVAVREVLGPDLVGVYAAGSVALGAYQPGRSDVDVAVVCARRLPSATRDRLVDRLRHAALPCPARGLELVVYRREVAARAGPDPGFELELNDGAGMAFHVASDTSERAPGGGTFWYAIDRSILAECGVALAGPPPGEVFGRLDDRALAGLLAAAVRWHSDAVAAGKGPAGTEVARTDDAVLNACRALHRVRTGTWASKPAAGRWLPESASDPGPRAVVERALAARTGGPPPTPEDARRFMRAVLAELAAAALAVEPPPADSPLDPAAGA